MSLVKGEFSENENTEVSGNVIDFTFINFILEFLSSYSVIKYKMNQYFAYQGDMILSISNPTFYP